MNHPYAPSLTQGSIIRLVDLHPGTWHDDVHCTLFQGSLGEEISYEALSYVWGSSANPKKIFLGDACRQPVTCTITLNLDTALRRLRHQECVRRL